MPPKRKNITSETSLHNEAVNQLKAKKTKSSTNTESETLSHEQMSEWMKKSAIEFNLHLDNKVDKDENEWKTYYENRKKATESHKKIVLADDFISMQGCIREHMEEILGSIDNLSEDDTSSIMKQFKFTKLDATLEDSSFDDMRSCLVEVIAYSDHSYESIGLKFDYHFRIREYGVEFKRNLMYSINERPSQSKSRKSNWYSNKALSEYEEKRKFGLTNRALDRMKKVLFKDSIQISNYELLQLLSESVGDRFGEKGHVKSDDWIGFNSRKICGCPSEEDNSYVAPTFQKGAKKSKSKKRRNSSDSDEEDDRCTVQ